MNIAARRVGAEVCGHDCMPFRACAGPPVKGWALGRQRLWALLVKRSCCARRDRLAVVTQLAVPILLVLVALWAGKVYVNSPDEPPLSINRWTDARRTQRAPGFGTHQCYHYTANSVRRRTSQLQAAASLRGLKMSQPGSAMHLAKQPAS